MRYIVQVEKQPNEPRESRYSADIFIDSECASGRNAETADRAARLAVADLLRSFAVEIAKGERPMTGSIEFEIKKSPENDE